MENTNSPPDVREDAVLPPDVSPPEDAPPLPNDPSPLDAPPVQADPPAGVPLQDPPAAVATEQEEPAPLPIRIATGLDRVQCPFCPSHFMDAVQYEKHLRNSKKCKRLRDPNLQAAHEAERIARRRAQQRRYNSTRPGRQQKQPTPPVTPSEAPPGTPTEPTVAAPSTATAVTGTGATTAPPLGVDQPLASSGVDAPGTPPAREPETCTVCLEPATAHVTQLDCGHVLHEVCRLQLFIRRLFDRIVDLQRHYLREGLIIDHRHREITAARERTRNRIPLRALEHARPAEVDRCLPTRAVVDDDQVVIEDVPDTLPFSIHCPVCRRQAQEAQEFSD